MVWKLTNNQLGRGFILCVMHHYCIVKMGTERQKKAISVNRDRVEMEGKWEIYTEKKRWQRGRTARELIQLHTNVWSDGYGVESKHCSNFPLTLSDLSLSFFFFVMFSLFVSLHLLSWQSQNLMLSSVAEMMVMQYPNTISVHEHFNTSISITLFPDKNPTAGWLVIQYEWAWLF